MKKEKMKKINYIWVTAATIILIIITFIVGILVFRFYLNGFTEAADEKKYNQYYVMITQEQKSSFWQSVYQGAYERGLEENIYVDLLGENLSQDYTREALMRIAISSGVDGIIVEADESEEMTALINEATEKDIPVVTLYSDNTHSNRCSFVGVGSYNLGREYGKQVLALAEEKEKIETPIKAAVLVSAYTQDSGQSILCAGIQDAINQEKPEEMLIDLSLITVDDRKTFSVEESIRDIFMENDIPDIIVCLGELHTTCVYQAVVDYNKVGDIGILGYYDSDTIIRAIDRNVINATVSVDTRQMGGFCIDALTEYKRYGNTSQYFTADITLIDKGNVGMYLEDDDNGEN